MDKLVTTNCSLFKRKQSAYWRYFIEIDGHTTFTLGYTLDSVYWSKGYASEALKSVFKAMAWKHILLKYVYVMYMKII